MQYSIANSPARAGEFVFQGCDVRGLGTLINTCTVLVGGGLGLVIGHRIPDRIRVLVVQVIGLVTLALGLSDVIKT